MTKDKDDFRKLACTLTHERLVEAGYCTHSGPDGFKHLLSREDQHWTIQQVKSKSTYGSFPPGFKFGGSRVAPWYWKKSDVALWLNQRYAHTDPALVRAAESAGFIVDRVKTGASGVFPRPKARRRGEARTKPKNMVKVPVRIWKRDKS
jgi:hypothetical protein